jgi:hypothetical protein
MPVQIALMGVGPNRCAQAVFDPTEQAARVSLWPLEWKNNDGSLQGGHYGLSATLQAISGTVAANTGLFWMRWLNSQKLFILKKLSVILTPTAVSSPTYTDLQVSRVSFTSTQIILTPAPSTQRCRTGMARSEFTSTPTSNIQTVSIMSSSASTIGMTIDANGFGYLNGFAGVANQSFVSGDLYKEDQWGEHPLIFGYEEGFTVTTPKGWAASNTQQLSVILKWAEAPAY